MEPHLHAYNRSRKLNFQVTSSHAGAGDQCGADDAVYEIEKGVMSNFAWRRFNPSCVWQWMLAQGIDKKAVIMRMDPGQPLIPLIARRFISRSQIAPITVSCAPTRTTRWQPLSGVPSTSTVPPRALLHHPAPTPTRTEFGWLTLWCKVSDCMDKPTLFLLLEKEGLAAPGCKDRLDALEKAKKEVRSEPLAPPTHRCFVLFRCGNFASDLDCSCQPAHSPAFLRCMCRVALPQQPLQRRPLSLPSL